jgi:hypothetical protein
MKTVIKAISFLCIALIIASCSKKAEKHLVFIEAKPGQIVLKADSVRFPPEMTVFPIQIKLINYSDKNAILSFKSVSNEFKYQTRNLYIVSGKDTLLLGINADKFIILDPHTMVTFPIHGYYDFTHTKRKYLFSDFKNFPKGNLTYQPDKSTLKGIKLDNLTDTVLVASRLQTNIDDIKVVSKFSAEAFTTNIKVNKK